jgi:hypothetical protein
MAILGLTRCRCSSSTSVMKEERRETWAAVRCFDDEICERWEGDDEIGMGNDDDFYTR